MEFELENEEKRELTGVRFLCHLKMNYDHTQREWPQNSMIIFHRQASDNGPVTQKTAPKISDLEDFSMKIKRILGDLKYILGLFKVPIFF